MPNVPKIVRERLRVANLAPAEHPDPDVLTAFAESSLSQRERADVLQHLSRCGECRPGQEHQQTYHWCTSSAWPPTNLATAAKRKCAAGACNRVDIKCARKEAAGLGRQSGRSSPAGF